VRTAEPGPGDALLLVDVQVDFLPGGALPVPAGDAVIAPLNHYVAHFQRRGLPVYATRDWHPADHGSFQAHGGPWPAHAVQHTPGAEFARGLYLPATAAIFPKGTDAAHEAYSGFAHPALEPALRAAGIHRLFLGGLATDYCVLHTARDALRRGFAVQLLRDAVRAVDLQPGDGARAEAELLALGATPMTLADLAPADPATSALLTDLYQLTMLRGYAAAGMAETAVFEFSVRRLPAGWNFLVAAGLGPLLDWLEDLRFTSDELAWLRDSAGFSVEFTRGLGDLRFTGDIEALPEGTVFFPHEPVVRVTAPLPEAQVIETRLINLLQLPILVASKAARCVLAAPGTRLVDFGLRRAQGAEAGVMAARAACLAGFAGTSNVFAARRLGLPLSGTMAHAFIEACPDEREAFLRFARANPGEVILLLDTYDTRHAAVVAAAVATQLRTEGIMLRGVRLDSGDLAADARFVRAHLDAAGLPEVRIFASGNLDEHALLRLHGSGAPIDGYGVGTRLVTSAGAPCLDCAYKLQVYAGLPRHKRSPGKPTWPGAKQVWRRIDADGLLEADLVGLAREAGTGRTLLTPVMRGGHRLTPAEPFAVARGRAEAELALLPPALRGLFPAPPHPVLFSDALRELARATGAVPPPGAGEGGGPR
jgi:nicotinate phosphoribosyltransferase